MHENNLVDKVPIENIETRLKAIVQSYYSRVENKDYIVKDSISEDAGN